MQLKERSCGDRIFKLIQQLERNVNAPDLHSFKASIKNGIVFVEARLDGIYIEHQIGDKEMKWVGLGIAAANRLEMLELDPDSVDM
jgi:hypothetical protein